MPAVKTRRLVLAAILLLSTVLRVGWPRLTEFKFSEARLAALCLELTREGHLPLVGVPSSAGFDHSPISVYLYAPAFLTTADPIPATIYGGFAGVAAVILCWRLARRRPGGRWGAAVVATLLLAVSPWSVAFSRKIWQVVFVVPLSIGFIDLTAAALIEENAETGRWKLAWGLVFYALLVQVHPSAISLAPAVLLWLLVFRRRVRFWPLLAGAGGGLLTAVPFLVHQAQNNWPVLSALKAQPRATWDLSSVQLAWEAITGRGIHALAGDAYPLLKAVPQLGWTFNLIGWLTVAGGLFVGWRVVSNWQATSLAKRQEAQLDLILLSWLLVPILFNLRHSLDLHVHFFALLMPAAYLIVGRATGAAWQVIQRKWVQGALKLAFGLLMGVQLVSLALMARFVATHITSGGFGNPLGRYLEVADEVLSAANREKAAEVLVVGQGDSPVVDETPAIFDVLLRDRIAYRFVDGPSAALFPAHRTVVLLGSEGGEAKEWYESFPVQNLELAYGLVTLDGSWPVDDLVPVPGARTFQNGVELQGYTWRDNLAAGEGRFWLLWQVLWLNPKDTHFFVQLVDQNGERVAQRDTVGYPSAYRQKGDRIITLFDITFPVEAEPTQARMGIYTYPDVVNVPVIDGDGKPIGEVVIVDLESRGP